MILYEIVINDLNICEKFYMKKLLMIYIFDKLIGRINIISYVFDLVL